MVARWFCRVAVLALVAGVLVVAPARAEEAPPGCDKKRRAVAHTAGGVPLRKQPARAPMACGMFTGFPGGESRIEVNNKGHVIFAPAGDFPDDEAQTTFFGRGGVAISENNGETWELAKPFGLTWHHNDQETFLDRATGRLFWAVMHKDRTEQVTTEKDGLLANIATPAYSHILSTDNPKESWTYSAACCEITNGGTVVAAKSPPGQPAPTGYENAVYYCWHGSQTFPGRPAEGLCQRSLDGGKTWIYRGHTHRAGVPVHAECPASATSVRSKPDGTSEVAGLPVADTTTGYLYMVLACNGQAYLTRSTDGAETWPVLHTIPRAGELRIDDAGNFYLMRSVPTDVASGTNEDHEALLLSVSTRKSQGAHWSAEYDVRAPGVKTVEAERTALYGGISCCTNWFFDVREPGHVAVAYSGRSGESGPLDGWITETRNALDANPIFWSATVNKPGEPVKYRTGHAWGADGRGFPLGGPQMNQVGIDIAPDGSPWAAFQQDCGPGPDAPRCDEWHHQTRGLAGRLYWRD